MRLLLLTTLLLLLPIGAQVRAELVEIYFENPGAGGMQSNYGIHTLNPDQLYFQYNVDTWTTPGVIMRRKGLQNYGNNSKALFGAFGYFNGRFGHSLILGVGNRDTTALGQFQYSDTTDAASNVTALQFDSLLAFELGRTMLHDWVQIGDNLIHSDGASTPLIFTTTQTFKNTDSTADTIGFDPHVVSLGLEAPGQLRPIVVDTTGNLNGDYQYALSFASMYKNDDEVWVTNTALRSRMGPVSATASPRSKQVRLSLFEGVPVNLGVNVDPIPDHYTWRYPDSTVAFILRRNLSGQRVWYIIDTVSYTVGDATDIYSYIDNVGDTISTKFTYNDTCTFRAPPPGSFRRIDTLEVATDTGSYRLAYSYYDPVTGIESPLGPTVSIGGAGDSIIAHITKGWSHPTLRPRWVRVYQSIVASTLPGGGDTTVFYGVFQGRANDLLRGFDTSTTYDVTYTVTTEADSLVMGDNVYSGITWADSQVVNGIDSADFVGGVMYDYNILRNSLGLIVVQPPYNYNCQIPFFDMEYANNRLFGIGDPIAPEALYFSEPNTWYTNVWNWPPLNYLAINEGVTGKLIALERAEGYGRDALYAFKRNAIYLIDFSVGRNVQLIESNIGPVSKEAMVKDGKTIYFLASDMQAYALHGQTVTPISDGIRNWIDTLFTSEIDAAEDCRAFRLGKSVKWFNSDATDVTGGLGLAFYPNALTTTGKGAWSLESYGDDSAYIPLGSFSYDSTSGGIMSGFPTTVTYSAAAVPLRTQADSVGLTLRTDVGASRFPTGFKFPFVGDGLNFWSPSSMDFTIIIPTTGTGLDYLRLEWRVVDEKGNVLAADSINVAATFTYSVDFAQVTTTATTGKWLSLWLRTDSDAAISGYDMYNHFELRDLRFWIKDEGRSNVY